jgi:MYXO-CTERM domain-containing protein
MRARIATAFVTAALISTLTARPAAAYVRGVTDQSKVLYWPTSCAAVTIYLNGFSMMTSDEVAKSIAAAAHAWSPAEVTCPGPNGDGGSGHPYFEIVPSMSTGGPVPEVATNDGKNSIVFQTTEWIHDPTAIALTQHFSGPVGEIVDTDIEINAVGFTWANLDPGSPVLGHNPDAIDLQTAITHEFGHFIGLGHTCFHAGLDLSIPNDDQDQPIPTCPDPPSTPADVPQAQSVMWFFVDHGSTTKRVLAPDDVRGICDIYPPAQDPHACALNLPDDGCGCAAAGTHGPPLSLLALVAAVAYARRRRGLRSDRDRRAAL